MENRSENFLVIEPMASPIFASMKRCARCGEEKCVSAFNVSKNKPDGRQPYCRLCQEDDRLRRCYDVTRTQRDRLYAHQQGQCHVCHAFHAQLDILYVQGLGVISLVCSRCLRLLHGFNCHPGIFASAIAYLHYCRSQVLYGVQLRVTEDWDALPPEKPQRSTGRRHSPRGVNPETYEQWSFWNNHLCYICREPCPTGRNLARDHQHVTNRNRGLLCLLCNTTLGVAKEDPALLHTCATFLASSLVPYIARFVWITEAMIADAEHDALWVSRAYSTEVPAYQRS